MKKNTSFSTKGNKADIGNLIINRILPNRYTDAVGPFVFLDHVVPKAHLSSTNSGTDGHPHRGIATVSYILEGQAEHFDSAGNNAKVYSGGVQWMKAGNGIIHDELINIDSISQSDIIHGFQFWINLPAKNKAEKPEYLAIQSDEVPQKKLPSDSGWIKVIVGNYEDLKSIIPNYSEQFLYHIHIESGKNFTINIREEIEIGAFLPTVQLILNGVEFQAEEFIEFDRKAGEIIVENKSEKAADIILFGGETYTETIVAEGPFVMNTQLEIAQAYKDFLVGKYGKIIKE